MQLPAWGFAARWYAVCTIVQSTAGAGSYGTIVICIKKYTLVTRSVTTVQERILRDKDICYRTVKNRLGTAEELSASSEQDKLLAYLFLCFVYLLRRNRANVAVEDAVWSDPETTFSIVIYHADGETHDHCCACIEALGAEWVRESGTTTAVSCESGTERDAVKNKFMILLNEARKRLARLRNRTPQEYFFLNTTPVIREIASTDNKHFVVLQADIQDAVDMLCVEETLQPWADYKRIRDYFEISGNDNGMAAIKMIFYRIRRQKEFIRYLQNLGTNGANRAA